MITGKIEIVVPDCPTYVPNVAGIPSWVIGSGMAIGVVIVLGLFILIGVVVSIRRERANDRRRAEIEMAKLHKVCDFCSSSYAPEVSK